MKNWKKANSNELVNMFLAADEAIQATKSATMKTLYHERQTKIAAELAKRGVL